MKILGVSFGRKMQCSEILAKQALFAAKDAGAEVEFINVVDMRIDHCKGCGACGNMKKGPIRCIIKDDYQILAQKVLEADGIIMAAPVYSVGTTGQYKNFLDRFGAANDRAAVIEKQKKRIEEGLTGDDLLPDYYFKKRYVAYISVGGAITQNWVSMGLPMMHLFGFSQHNKVVGHLDAYDQGRRGNPVLDDQLMADAYGLGKHLAESIGKEYDDVEWYGEEGICPVCHNKLLAFGANGLVECPICGIEGSISIENGQLKAEFSKEQRDRARSTLAGLYEHQREIASMIPIAVEKITAAGDELQKKLEKFKNFEQYI